MRNRFGWLCLAVALVTALAVAQTPTFTFTTVNQSVCPASNSKVGSVVLTNLGATSGTINAGSIFNFLFDAPVIALPTYTGPGPAPAVSSSGNSVRLTFGSAVTVAGGGTLRLDGTRLNLSGAADGTLIGVEGTGFAVTSGNNVGNVATSAPIITSPTSLTFTVATNSSNSAAQNLTLSGRGIQFPFQVTPSTMTGGNWLTVNPPVGPATSVNVTATATGLQTQTYTGAVDIADSLGNPCANVPVSLSVVTPSLSVSVASLSFTALSTDTFVPVQQFTIGANTGTLNWTAVASTSSGGNWLTLNPLLGSTPTAVNAQVIGFPTTPGTYQGSITITASGASNSPLVIPVTLVITAAPSIQVSPTTLSFTVPQGAPAPPNQTFQVTNGAGGTLNFQATAVTQTGGPWLSVTPASATAPSTLTVSVKPTVNGVALSAGTYNGSIQLTASGAGNSPQGVAVTLTVTAAAQSSITLSPASLQFAATPGTASPSPVNVQISNSGPAGTTLGWNATVATSDGLNWLSVFPTTGVAPSTVQVAVNSTSLAAGTYTGTVRIDATASSNASNSPQTLNVTLGVGTPLVPPGGVVNGASFAANTAVGPGGIASIFGSNLAGVIATADKLPLPTNLGGVQVVVNGTLNAPLFYVSPTQINLQIPVEVTGTSATLVVKNGALQGNTVTVPLTTEAPGIFTVGASGSGQAAALNADSTPNSGSNPATQGQVISFFATGLGATVPPYTTGQVGASQEPLNRTVQQPIVTIGTVPATVQYSGLAPGFVGLYQVNVLVPATLTTNANTPVQLTINGKTANAVTIAVK